MKEIIYRDLVKEDYPAIKNLINEAFGFDDFVKDKKFLDLLLNVYLQDCILASTYSRVAEKDSKIIGLILGSAEKDKKKIRKPHNYLSLAATFSRLIFVSKENRKTLKEFTKIQKVYNELIEGKKDSFQGCIQLFIVSKESRGLGVGKSLLAQLSNYMKNMMVKSLYLYTDTRCNYGFYDSQNFKRLGEKEMEFDSVQDKLDVFLYGYTFK